MLRFLIYRQEILINMNFQQVQMLYRKEDHNKKAVLIKRFEYLPLVVELKKQTGVPKDQYKFFKHQMNAINNSNWKALIVTKRMMK